MALIFMDGFDYLPVQFQTTPSSPLNAMWTNGNKWTGYSTSGGYLGTSTTTPYSFGLSLYSFISSIHRTLGANYTTLFAGFNFYCTGFGNTPQILSFNDGGNGQVSLVVSSSGHLTAQSYAGGSICVSSSSLSTNTWYYVEFSSTFSASGTVQIRVNGSTVASGTGNTANSGNSYANTVYIGTAIYSGPPPVEAYFDDFILMDGTGSSLNGFQGPLRIYSVLPDSDVSNTGWALSSGGTVNSLINETATSTANYVESSVSSSEYLVGCAGLYGGAGAVQAVAVNVVAQASASTPASFTNTLKSGSTTVNSTAFTPVVTTPGIFQSIYTTDPNTSAPWSTSAVNSIQVGATIS